MVNSAAQALAEFKTQRLGGLMAGTSSTVSSPIAKGVSLSDSASDRLARSAPKRSTTAFMDQIRQRHSQANQMALQNIQAQRTAQSPVGASGGRPGGSGYRLPSGGGSPQTGGPRGAYGLAVPAAQAFNALAGAYSKAGYGQLSIVSGGRTRQEQAHLYALYKAGKGNKAAPPGQSLHESGIAADFGGAAHNLGRAHTWLQQNAANFGWYWVGQRYGEPWHWEYHPEWK